MRKIIVSIFVSLDGVMEDPGGSEKSVHGAWTFPYWNDEIGKAKFDELFASDALLLGRVTYEGFAAAWPSQKDDSGFADRMNSLPKYVVSGTMKEAKWNNTNIIKGNIPVEVAKLKEKPGQDILIGGSRTLVRTLMQHDLIDMYRLLVYPIVLGSGKRLFEEGSHAKLNLVECKHFSSDVVLLEYQSDKKE
jgi:dihydrofolate reductase